MSSFLKFLVPALLSCVFFLVGCSATRQPVSVYPSENSWLDEETEHFVQWSVSGDFPWQGVANLVVRKRWQDALSAIDTSSLDIYDRTFLKGYLLYKLGQYSSAKNVLMPFLDSLAGYELGDWARFYLADASFNSGDYDLALSTVRNLGPLQGLTKEIAALRWKPLVRKLRLSEAMAALDTLHQNGWLTRTEYDFYYAQVLYDRGNAKLALQRVIPIARQYPQGDVGLAVAHFLEKYVSEDNYTRWFIGNIYYENRRWDQAIRWLKEYIERGGQKNVGTARFYIAKSYMELRRYHDALGYLRKMQKNREQLAWTFWAMARCYRKLKDYRKAEEFSDSAFAVCGENSSMCSTILLEKIFWARDRRDYEKVAKVSEDHIRFFPKETKSDVIALWGALSYMKIGDFRSADELLRKSITHFKDEDFKNEILFWRAYLLYLSGDTLSADSILAKVSSSQSAHISRFWAEEFLGSRLPKPVGYIPVRNFCPDSIFSDAADVLAEYGKKEIGLPDSPSDYILRQQAVRLARLGLIALARNVLVELEKKQEKEKKINVHQRLALWRLYWDIGMYELACIQGEKIARTLNTSDPRILRLWFVMPFQSLVDSIARMNDIDPYLVYSVMMQESRFFPWAGSVAGALGLMQIMPNTGKSVARKLKIHHFDEQYLYDYLLNLDMGIWFLKKLIDKHGNVSYALAEYNAGSSPLENWISSCPVDDDKVYIEWCDYEQTRRYMKRIWAGYYLYRIVWGE